MEIYLQHREKKQLVCLRKLRTGTIEIDIYLGYNGQFDISYSIYEDEHIDCRFSWYISRSSSINENGKYYNVKDWKECNKEKFMKAYSQAANQLLTFIQEINPK